MLKLAPLLATVLALALTTLWQARSLQARARGGPVPPALTAAAVASVVLSLVLLSLRFVLL